MNYEHFKREIDFNRENPAEYNYYIVGYDREMTVQEFVSAVYEKAGSLENLWAHKAGNIFYVMTEKSDVLSSDVAPIFEVVEYSIAEEQQ
jgi:hypothetical protein